MKSSTNVSDPKKKKESTTKDKVLKIYRKADEKASKALASDTKKASDYDKSRKSRSKKFTTNEPDIQKKGRLSTKDLQASGAYAGKVNSNTETQRVRKLQETGAYDAKPAVVGGTKKMLTRSKKNVKKSQASKQAKRSAKKLY
jgi:hypothetical protein